MPSNIREMMEAGRVWKVIPFAPSYEVSDDGRVRRCAPGRTNALKVGTELKQSLSSQYSYVCLMTPGHPKPLKMGVHVLVCTIFHGERPTPKHQVAHLNGVSTDNRATNVAWATPKENTGHKYAHGTMPLGDASPRSKLTREQVEEIRALRLCRRRDYIAFAKRFGVHPQTVAMAARGDTWRNLPLTRQVVRTIGVKK